MELTSLSITGIPKELYKRLKIRATEEDKTIKDFVIGLFEKELGKTPKSRKGVKNED